MLHDLNSAQLTTKNRRLLGTNILKTAGRESNFDGFEVESKTVKFDFDSTMGAIEIGGLPRNGRKSSRNMGRNSIGRSHTMQGQAPSNLNTMVINPDASFITEDIEIKDLDEENREPFADQPSEKGKKAKHSSSDFRKLKTLSKEITSNLDKLGSEKLSDKFKNTQKSSKLSSQGSQKS